MNVSDAMAKAAKKLEKAGVPDASLDAQRLMGRVLAWSQLDLIAKGGENLAAGLKKKFDALVARREKREPLQYVTGTVEFSGLRLEIDRRALVPRPETEMLVEAVLAEKTDGPARALDACTGSGAVALALKKGWGALEVTGSDVSQDALKLARENARRLELEVQWVRADLFRPFVRPFHFITVNPPYIAEGEFAGLQPEVRDWEPRRALIAGPEGTEILSRIAGEAAALLWPAGLIAVELAPSQAKSVADSFEAARSFDSIRVLQDFQGLDRVVLARRWKNS
ncbi:MAG: peptide chain release factor N(5)-glutamine methyltransferase [Planctomycetes bacterium]|nr:peptide chain release factor N(5)-glutamine methyltransferase [Planctomycetota bacterium]